MDELGDESFTVVAVALDSEPGAPDPWIEAASPTYPVLIDRTHQVADRYGIVNVPTAIWIDESGKIVRPAEVAGAYEAFRHVDPETRAVPEEHLAHSKQVRSAYLDAIRDWVARGSDSEHVLSAADARDRQPAADPAVAEAHARFRLGQHLEASGNREAARIEFEAASRLHPESWAIWRQAADKLENGIAAGPAFSARLAALGDKHYYPPPEIAGMPEAPARS